MLVWLFNLCNLLLEVKWRSIWLALSFQWKRKVHKITETARGLKWKPFLWLRWTQKCTVTILTFATSRLRPPSGQGQQIPLPESEGSKKGQLGPGKKQLKHSREAPCHFSLSSLPLSLSSSFFPLPLLSSPFLSSPLFSLKERKRRVDIVLLLEQVCR